MNILYELGKKVNITEHFVYTDTFSNMSGKHLIFVYKLHDSEVLHNQDNECGRRTSQRVSRGKQHSSQQ